MSLKTNKGFTLIELLVVIAIIGILSSVVLASLNTARDKGRDGAIKSSMQTVRVQSEIYYDDNSSGYGTAATANGAETACNAGMFTDATIAAAVEDVTSNALANPECILANVVNGQAQNWAFEAQLRDSTFWCTDFTGIATGSPASRIDDGDTDCSS